MAVLLRFLIFAVTLNVVIVVFWNRSQLTLSSERSDDAVFETSWLLWKTRDLHTSDNPVAAAPGSPARVVATHGYSEGVAPASLGAGSVGVAGFHLERFIVSPVGDLVPKEVRVADVDGDRRNDVVELLDNWTECWLRVYVQREDGSLAAPMEFVVPSENDQSGLGLVDLDRNGIPEIVVGTSFGVTIFQNRSGVFVQQFHEGNQRALHLDGIDANGDGNPDVFAQSWSEGADIYLGDGKGGITDVMHMDTYAFGYNTQEIADFTADGHPDVIQTNGQGGASVWIYPTRPGMGLQPHLLFNLPAEQSSPPTGLTVADMDQDGWPDLVASDWGHGDRPKGVHIYYGSRANDFQRRQFLPLEGYYQRPGALAVADLDGNSHPDIVVMHDSNDELSYFLQDASGFGDYVVVRTDDNLWTNNHYLDNSFAIADVNSDRCPDVVLAEMSSSLRIFYGRGCRVRWPQPSRPLPPLGG